MAVRRSAIRRGEQEDGIGEGSSGPVLEADVRGTRVPVTVSTLPFYFRKES